MHGPKNRHGHLLTRLVISQEVSCIVHYLCNGVIPWQWFTPCTPVSPINKTGRHVITEILLKVALNTIKQKTNKQYILVVASHRQIYHTRFEVTTSVVICTDCKGSCKSNYHTITAMTAPGMYCH
jgi:hypothetical protein